MSSLSESGMERCALDFSPVAMAHAGCVLDSSWAAVGIVEDPLNNLFRLAQLEDPAHHPRYVDPGKSTPLAWLRRTDTGEEFGPCEAQRTLL